MARLTPHVLFALRRAHDRAVRALDDARDDAVRTHDRAEEARRAVAAFAAEEAELRAALDAHVDAIAAEHYQKAPGTEFARPESAGDLTPAPQEA